MEEKIELSGRLRQIWEGIGRKWLQCEFCLLFCMHLRHMEECSLYNKEQSQPLVETFVFVFYSLFEVLNGRCFEFCTLIGYPKSSTIQALHEKLDEFIAIPLIGI